MELAILALILSIISGVGAGVCTVIYLRQSNKESEEE